MEKIFNINLNDIKNDADIFYRFYKATNHFYYNTEEQWREKINETKTTTNWDAFADNISGLTFDDDTKKVIFIIHNSLSVKNLISANSHYLLLWTLASLTDPAQRVDKYDFYFQIRD